MKTIKVYVPLPTRGEDGKWYREFDVVEGLPLDTSVVYVAPPTDLLYPRWDNVQGVWIEDKDSIIVYMKDKIDELEKRIAEVKGS